MMNRARYLFVVALALIAFAITACGGRAEQKEQPNVPTVPAVMGSRSLMSSLGVVAQAGAPVAAGEGIAAVDLRNLTRVAIGGSDREAVATTGDVSWRTPVNLPPSAILAFSVSGPDEAANGTLSLEANGAKRKLLAFAVRPGQPWTPQRVDIGNDTPLSGNLVLESDGPVVWSELYLSPVKVDLKAPNLVLVVIDTVREDHLGYAGYEWPTSPNLDRFAGESYVFSQALSASTWTIPSTASILTGLFPDQHRAQAVETPLPESVTTVAERLRKKGYRTAAFSDSAFVNPEWGFAQGFERFDTFKTTVNDPGQGSAIAAMTDAASKWVQDDPGRPWFVFVHTDEPHEPYWNLDGFADKFLSPEVKGNARTFAHVSSTSRSLEPRELARIEALYDGEIARADSFVGRFLDALRKQPGWGNTAVIVTSDQGEEFQEHGGLEHGLSKVFDENVRVPLLVRPPGGTARRNSAAPVGSVDVAPTLMAFAGISVDPGLPGRSLVDVVEQNLDRIRLVQGFNSDPSIHENRVRIDRGGRALVVDRVRGDETMYNLEADPGMKTGYPPSPDEPLRDSLQAIMGWMSDGDFAVRLPPEVRSIEIPEGSLVAPVSVWRELSYSSVEPSEPIRFSGIGPTILIFDLEAGSGDWTTMLGGQSGPPLEATLEHEHAAGGEEADTWRPLGDRLPGLLRVYRTSEHFESRLRPR